MKGMQKDKTCRFGCGKGYSNEHYRNNHETNCRLNPHRGHKVVFDKFKDKWKLIGKA